jgi:hypothetical protein
VSWRFWKQDGAVSRFWKPDGAGGVVIDLRADVGAALDRNRAMATHNDGYSASRELRRVAHIPDIVRLKWLNEEGWDCLAAENSDRLAKKLNDADWRHLRTAEGRVGVSNGVLR